MRHDLAEIRFQSSLQEALVSSSGMGTYIHSSLMPIQHFLCRPRRRPPKGWFLERLSKRVRCPNHANFRLLTVARRGSCKPTNKLNLLRTQSLVLRSKEIRRNFLVHLVSKAWTLFFRVSVYCTITQKL